MAALSVPTFDAQLVHNVADILPSATDIIRSSEEDALSPYGGGDFDQQGIQPTVDNTELLQFIDNSMILSEEADPPLSEHLAKILNAKYLVEFDTSKRKELLNKYKIPRKCESFVVPKVNPDIWQKLPAHAKWGAMAIFTQQATLLCITSSISSVIDDLLSARQSKETPTYQHLSAKIIDSVALLGHVNKELSFTRRELLRPNLSQDFTQACSRKIEVGTFLFGDDLPQVIQQLRTTNRLVKSVTTNFQQARMRTSGFTATSSLSRPTLLGQRGG